MMKMLAVAFVQMVVLCGAAFDAGAACAPPDSAMAPIAFGDTTLVAVCCDVWVDPTATTDERARIATDFADAVTRVTTALGAVGEQPSVVLCKSERCVQAFAGSAHRSLVRSVDDRLDGATFKPQRRTIVIVHVGAVADVLTHELVHTEVQNRLRGAQLPPWFNEGLATSIGRNASCPVGTGRAIDDLRRLANNTEWMNYTNVRGKLEPMYCQARAEVDAWLVVGHHSTTNVVELINGVRDGKSFEALYGPMMTQTSSPMSTVTMSYVSDLADNTKPFSFALWVKPRANEGVLVHASSNAIGTGWCGPLVGFDAQHHLVAQVIRGNGPDPSQYDIARAPRSLLIGKWTHVALTWAPRSSVRLYVDGKQSAAIAATGFNTRNAGSGLFVTWGSGNIGGSTAQDCWPGAIAPKPFQGALTEPTIYNVELAPTEVAKLANARP